MPNLSSFNINRLILCNSASNSISQNKGILESFLLLQKNSQVSLSKKVGSSHLIDGPAFYQYLYRLYRPETSETGDTSETGGWERVMVGSGECLWWFGVIVFCGFDFVC